MELPLLATGAAAWKAGHAAVRSGTLVLRRSYDITRDDPEIEPELETHAAAEARGYMRQAVARLGLTQAQGVRVFMVYMHAYINGVLDEATGATEGGAE
jgi:hypothetical protein